MGRLKVEGVVTGVIALDKEYKCSVLIEKHAERYYDGNQHNKTSIDNAHILHKSEAAYTHKARPAMTYPFNQRAFL